MAWRYMMSGNVASFSLLALEGDEWLASHPDCFMSRGKTLNKGEYSQKHNLFRKDVVF